MSKLWTNLRRLRRMGCEHSSGSRNNNNNSGNGQTTDENPLVFKGKSMNDKKKTVEPVTLEG